jgi:hypothetical protein
MASLDGEDDDIDWAKLPKDEREMIVALAKLLVGLKTAGIFGKWIVKAVYMFGGFVLLLLAIKNGTLSSFNMNWLHL